MPQIYHLLPEDEPFSEWHGGAVSRWAANVLRDGDEIVVCPTADDSWGFPEARILRLPRWAQSHPIHPILYRMPWSLQQRFYSQLFERLMEKLEPGNILYTHNRPESAAVLALMAKSRGVRVVLHMHNSHLTRASSGQLAALRDVDLVVCSDFLRQEIERIFPDHFKRTHLIYNGADPLTFYAGALSENAVPQVVFTGRLIPQKGVHILLKAMQLLEDRGVAVRCSIAGASAFGGSKRTRYVRRLDAMRPANVEFVGYKRGPQLGELLRASDVYCCPSIWQDPFPLSTLEAMGCGLPVVASRVGGLPEALADGGGVLVASDDAELLASAIEGLVTDKTRRLQLRQEALAVFNNRFRWSRVRERYLDVVQSISSYQSLRSEQASDVSALGRDATVPYAPFAQEL